MTLIDPPSPFASLSEWQEFHSEMQQITPKNDDIINAINVAELTIKHLQGMQSFDADFGNAVQKAGASMDAGDKVKSGADLAEYLLSDRPLGAGERQMLAWLVTGQLSQSVGKPTMTAGHPKVEAILARFDELADKNELMKSAVSLTAEEFGISSSTVNEYRRWRNERKNAEKHLIKNHLIP